MSTKATKKTKAADQLEGSKAKKPKAEKSKEKKEKTKEKKEKKPKEKKTKEKKPKTLPIRFLQTKKTQHAVVYATIQLGKTLDEATRQKLYVAVINAFGPMTTENDKPAPAYPTLVPLLDNTKEAEVKNPEDSVGITNKFFAHLKKTAVPEVAAVVPEPVPIPEKQEAAKPEAEAPKPDDIESTQELESDDES